LLHEDAIAFGGGGELVNLRTEKECIEKGKRYG